MRDRSVALVAALADLVLPVACPGCAAPGGLCGACRAALIDAEPRAVRPTPAPSGLPPCVAIGDYGGVLRDLILSYKERGRHGLAAPLGDALAVACAGLLGGTPPSCCLVPVPSSAAAARARHGDHMLRLARRAAVTLRRAGVPTRVARPLRVGRRRDSAGLTSAERMAEADSALVPRSRRMARLAFAAAAGTRVVVVDDIVTTGATLAAVSKLLVRDGVTISGAAVIAATVRRLPPVK